MLVPDEFVAWLSLNGQQDNGVHISARQKFVSTRLRNYHVSY